MFGPNHYVPILKGREGEYGALRSLTPLTRQALTPLIEIPPIPWDFAEERPAKSVDQHLEKVGRNIERAWTSGGRLFLDLLWIPGTERMTDGSHPLAHVFESLRTRQVEAVPVVGLVRGEEYVSACRAVVDLDHRGVCVRVQREDFEDFEDVSDTVKDILDHVGVGVGDADLVFDLRALTPDERNLDASAVIGLINRLPCLRNWRTFTVTATSFPRNLTGLPPSDVSLIARQEWDLWTAIFRGRNRQIARVPTFGDYAISHPEPAEVDPRIMRPSASIRYTCNSAWLILKAKNLRDHGYQQFQNMCVALIRRSEYCGQQFSMGDQYIDDCAARLVGTGNLTTWRKVGTSHHLAFAVRQIANQTGS